MSHEDIKALSEAYRSIYASATEYVEEESSSEEQIDEARAMSAKDFGKRIDSIEDAHQEIKMSLVDSIEDVSKRKRAESALQKAYDQYFKRLSEIERMMK